MIACLQTGVMDLAELQQAHMHYLMQAQHCCLMSDNTQEVRAIIEPVLQGIVDLAVSLRYVDGTCLCTRNGRDESMHRHN